MMNHQLDLIVRTLARYAVRLPWGFYFYSPESNQLRQFSREVTESRFAATEKYLADIMREICQTTCEKDCIYTERSEAGLIYIGFPVRMENKIWAALATYLSLGREGSYRRSLGRGPTVAETLDLLEEMAFIITAQYQFTLWHTQKLSAGEDKLCDKLEHFP